VAKAEPPMSKYSKLLADRDLRDNENNVLSHPGLRTHQQDVGDLARQLG